MVGEFVYVCMYVCMHVCMYVCMHACMYVHVQVCHFGSVLTICVPGVRIYVMYMRMLYICVCVCEVILFSCDVRLGVVM